MNMRKHEGNTLIKFCAETKANSKGNPAKKKLYLTLIYGTSEDAQREQAVEMGEREKPPMGRIKKIMFRAAHYKRFQLWDKCVSMCRPRPTFD